MPKVERKIITLAMKKKVIESYKTHNSIADVAKNLRQTRYIVREILSESGILYQPGRDGKVWCANAAMRTWLGNGVNTAHKIDGTKARKHFCLDKAEPHVNAKIWTPEELTLVEWKLRQGKAHPLSWNDISDKFRCSLTSVREKAAQIRAANAV